MKWNPDFNITKSASLKRICEKTYPTIGILNEQYRKLSPEGAS